MSFSIANINRITRQSGLADECEYFIKIDDQPEDAFIVESINIEHWQAVGNGCQASVKVLARQAFDPAILLGKKAVLCFLWRGAMAPLVGEIEKVSEGPGNGDMVGFYLTLLSPLAKLNNQYHNRVFLDRSSLDIARDILTEFSDGRFGVTVLANEPEERAMTVQYNESDWDFLNRILLSDGIMVHTHHQQDALDIVLVDDLASLPLADTPLLLPFRSARGAAADEEYISVVRSQWQSTVASVNVADYQASRAEHIVANSEFDEPSGHADYRWGGNHIDSASAQRFAELLTRAHQSRKNQLFLQTNCRGLRPGMVISLTGHTHWSGEYRVLEVECEGQQFSATNSGSGTQGKAFINHVLVIPAGIPYLPLLPDRRTVTSTLTASIAAEVDESGYYQVRLPFDSQSEGDHTSIPTRMVQAFGGKDHGMHFPLTVGTEVIVGFENGDVDRPVILGAVHNDDTPSVVTQENAYQNLIRTRGGHEFLLDDSPSKERIQLNTAEAKNRIHLDATEDAHKAELYSEQGDVVVEAGKDIRIESGQNMHISVGADQEVTVGGDLKAMTEAGDIVHQAGGQLLMTAAESMEWVSEEGDLNIEAGGQWIVEAAEGVSVHTVSGDHQTVMEDGSFHLEAASNIELAAGNSLTLTQGSSTLQIDSSGNLTLDGSSVEITADKIAIKGGTVGNN